MLVATDVAARGIHVDDVDVVVHYDPPEEHKSYVHRSGRTARAGNEGIVVTFVLWDQELDVEKLQRRLGIREPIIEVFSNDPAPRRPRCARRSRTAQERRLPSACASSARAARCKAPRAGLRRNLAGMTDDWSIPLDGESFSTGKWIEVRAPVRRRAARPGPDV